MAGGRPSIYTEELANEICLRISRGEAVVRFASEEDFPSEDTIYRWIFEKPEFSEKYARAREIQMERMAHEIMQIADETPTMTQPDPDGGTSVRVDPGGVQRNRVRVDTRKWLMSKMAPKKYGDKQVVDLNVNESLAERLDSARKRSS